MGESPRMFIASNIQICGMAKEWAWQVVKISLDTGSLRGVLDDTISVWGNFIREKGGA
jgi:hypothetical protein